MYRFCSVLLILIVLLGCASEREQLIYSANYAEVQKRVEAEIRQTGRADSAKLRPLCDAYAALKRYDRLFECCDRLEANIRKGDKYGVSLDDTAGSMPFFGDAPREMYARMPHVYWDISSWPSLLRSQAYLELGQYRKAIEEAKKVYVMVPMTDMERIVQMRVCSILGLAYALEGDRENTYKVAARLDKLRLPSVLKIDQNIALARIYLGLGDFPRALDAIQREGSTYYAFQEFHQQFMLNKCLLETGRVADAKRGYDVLLKIPQMKDSGELYWIILFDRGRIAEKEGDVNSAVTFYRQAVDVIEQARASIHTDANKIGFVGDKQAVYHHMIAALCKNGQYEKAFEYVERAKARALVDVLATKKDFAIKRGNEQEIRTALAMNDSAEYEAILQDKSIDKSKTRSIQVKTREDLQKQAPELASLVAVTSPSVADLQSLISGEESLVEYYYRDKDMYAFILSDGGLQTIKLNSDGLMENIQAFRKLVETPGANAATGAFTGVSEQLYKRLFQPLERSLRKRNLVLVSHGALHYLPFYALHDGTGYLIDRYSIRMMPSASAMKYLGVKKTARAGGVLIFGNPDLGDPKQDLEYAQKEANEVARIVPNSKVFVRKEATEEALRRNCKDFNYIHFATHGQFNPEAPLKSALFLAPDAGHSGLLTVDKLYSLNLDADLVTLSACETGLSKVANGDDLVGLTRGFFYAGSSSIVASLWKVDDLATSQLMTSFYLELRKTNKQEALRKSQLETKKKYPHPYYWASFQLMGNAN